MNPTLRMVFKAWIISGLVYWAALASATSTSSSKPPPTGHRFIRGDRDFTLYVIKEALPTILLVHSSNEEDCDPALASCAEIFEDVKAAAIETKGYVRFATINVAEAEGKHLAENVLKLDQKPPMMLAFAEKASDSGKGGRPAMRVPLQNKPTVATLKKVASDLLPTNVHRSKTVADFEKLLETAQKTKSPVIALFAPKLSEKPTPMLKAAWAMLQGTFGFTLVDYSVDAGKEIVTLLEKAFVPGEATPLDKNETFIIGVDETRIPVKSNDTSLTPDSIHEFANWFLSKRNKKSSSSKKDAPPKRRKPMNGVHSGLSQEDYDRLVLRPNTASIIALRKRETVPLAEETDVSKFTPPADEAPSNATWLHLAQTMFTQFGIHSAVIHCDHQTDAPKVCADVSSEWTFLVYPHRALNVDGATKERKPQTVASLKEAMDKATKSFLEAEKKEDETDKLEVFTTGAAALDFLQISMATFANPAMRSHGKMPVMYLDNSEDEEPPSFLLAAHATMRKVAKIVRVRNPSPEELKQLHLDPAITFLPTLVAYVPVFQEVKQEEPKGKKKGAKQQPPQQQLSYHVVPFDPVRSGFGGANAGLQYETTVLFLQDLLNRVDVERWETFIMDVFPITAPPALANPLTERLMKSKGHDITTKIAPPVKAEDRDSFIASCEDTKLCVVFLAESFEGTRQEAIEDARKGLEKIGVGSGIRLVLVDGSCHFGVVEALGGDPSMLPVVASFNPDKQASSIMKGAFTSDNIQTFIRNAKRGTVAVQTISKNPADAFSNPSDCVVSTTKEAEEDDLLKELREEAEREAKEKEQARKQAEDEGRRLKDLREQELKKQRETLNKLAEEERLKKKKAQMELDEQRLAKKKEQQRLDEERLAAAKKKKEEL